MGFQGSVFFVASGSTCNASCKAANLAQRLAKSTIFRGAGKGGGGTGGGGGQREVKVQEEIREVVEAQ